MNWKNLILNLLTLLALAAALLAVLLGIGAAGIAFFGLLGLRASSTGVLVLFFALYLLADIPADAALAQLFRKLLQNGAVSSPRGWAYYAVDFLCGLGIVGVLDWLMPSVQTNLLVACALSLVLCAVDALLHRGGASRCLP